MRIRWPAAAVAGAVAMMIGAVHATEIATAPPTTPELRDAAKVPPAARRQSAAAALTGAAFVAHVCRLLEATARDNGIPEGFFARLIWTESGFDPNAVSPKGAEGIAQFMPGTARLRGLGDPFDPDSALPESARYLAELRESFGNLGLAAAAYNAGEARVQTWLEGRSGLPYETQDYVLSITGLPAEAWVDDGIEPPDFTLDKKKSFQDGCRALPTRPTLSRRVAKWQPWGVHVAAHPSRTKALAIYARMQRKYKDILGGRLPMVVAKVAPGMGNRKVTQVRIGADSRAEATRLCNRLRNAGGNCVVLKN